MFQIGFVDHRPRIIDRWKSAFLQSAPSAAFFDHVFFSTSSRAISELMEIDASVMLAGPAHERFGGAPILGRAQVLVCNSDKYNSSPFVVTTVPMPGQLVINEQDGMTSWQVVPTKTMDPERESFIVFGAMFRAISEFNVFNDDKIAGLLIELGAFNVRNDVIPLEARGAARAFSAHRSELAAGGFGNEIRADEIATMYFKVFSSSEKIHRSNLKHNFDVVKEFYMLEDFKRQIATENISLCDVLSAIFSDENGVISEYKKTFTYENKAKEFRVAIDHSYNGRVAFVNFAYNPIRERIYLRKITFA